MNKIIREEGKLWITEPSTISIWGHKFTKEEFDKLVIGLKTPTFDEVGKAWEDNGYILVPGGERIYFNRNGYEIEFKIKEIEYEYEGFITLELHKLINLTIRYLESQKEDRE